MNENNNKKKDAKGIFFPVLFLVPVFSFIKREVGVHNKKTK